VLMAYGRCLRPALYSSLRSSPSHPTGVSALRVTIAIANARCARKQWGASQVNCQSRGGAFAMNRSSADVFGQPLLDDPPAMTLTAFCRKSPRVPRVCWLGSWAVGTSNRGGQDKSRKVRPVGRLGNVSSFNHAPNIAMILRNSSFSPPRCLSSVFDTLRRAR
jgi:hypothetical protein